MRACERLSDRAEMGHAIIYGHPFLLAGNGNRNTDGSSRILLSNCYGISLIWNANILHGAVKGLKRKLGQGFEEFVGLDASQIQILVIGLEMSGKQ